MDENTRQAKRLLIGDLVLDTGKHEVSRDGQAVDLPGLSYQLIVVLAEAAPNVVSHNELVGQVWPGKVISPETITQRIKLARQAIGDDAHDPRYIGLVRGEGYRMLAEVEPLPPDPKKGNRLPAPVPEFDDQQQALDKKRKAVWFVAILATVVVVATLTIWPTLRKTTTDTQLDQEAVTSVAVLPFADMSPKQDQEYFADGIAEELRLELQGLDGLRVAGRTSSIASAQEDNKTIGEILNVDSILAGSIRKEGNSVRISVQLTHVAGGFTIWSESYDRELENIFEMQEEIATSVAGALGVRLGVGTINAFRGAGTRNVEAYEAYLQGQDRDRNLTNQERMRLFERATELDPNYAVAWSEFGLRTLATTWDFSLDQASEIVDRAYPLVLRGVELNPESAVAQLRLAQVLGARNDWIGGEQGYLRAMELLADRPLVASYGSKMLRVGRTAYAQKQYAIAVALEPLGGQPVRMSWHASLTQGRFAEAREISDWPGAANPIENYLDIALNERDPEALKAAIQALPKTSIAAISLHAPVLAEFDSPERILSLLRDVYQDENLQWPRKLHDIAMVAAYFGDPQFALKVKGEEVRAATVRLHALWYPVMSEVRQLPEFKILVTELNLVEYWRAYGWADACRPLGDNDFTCM